MADTDPVPDSFIETDGTVNLLGAIRRIVSPVMIVAALGVCFSVGKAVWDAERVLSDLSSSTLELKTQTRDYHAQTSESIDRLSADVATERANYQTILATIQGLKELAESQENRNRQTFEQIAQDLSALRSDLMAMARSQQPNHAIYREYPTQDFSSHN